MSATSRRASAFRRLRALFLVVGAACDTVTLGQGPPGSPDAATGSSDAADAGDMPLAGLEVLLVAGSYVAENVPLDDILAARLRANGLRVRRIDHRAEEVPMTPAPAFVVVSGSAFSEALPGWLADSAWPLVVMENYYCAASGMTGPTEGPDFGLVMSATVDMGAPPPGEPWPIGPIAVSADPRSSIGYCAVTPDAHVVARVGDRAVYFGYEAGDAMIGRAAPGRRIVVFLRTEAIASTTDAGFRLFETALRWAARPRP